MITQLIERASRASDAPPITATAAQAFDIWLREAMPSLPDVVREAPPGAALVIAGGPLDAPNLPLVEGPGQQVCWLLPEHMPPAFMAKSCDVRDYYTLSDLAAVIARCRETLPAGARWVLGLRACSLALRVLDAASSRLRPVAVGLGPLGSLLNPTAALRILADADPEQEPDPVIGAALSRYRARVRVHEVQARLQGLLFDPAGLHVGVDIERFATILGSAGEPFPLLELVSTLGTMGPPEGAN